MLWTNKFGRNNVTCLIGTGYTHKSLSLYLRKKYILFYLVFFLLFVDVAGACRCCWLFFSFLFRQAAKHSSVYLYTPHLNRIWSKTCGIVSWYDWCLPYAQCCVCVPLPVWRSFTLLETPISKYIKIRYEKFFFFFCCCCFSMKNMDIKSIHHPSIHPSTDADMHVDTGTQVITFIRNLFLFENFSFKSINAGTLWLVLLCCISTTREE